MQAEGAIRAERPRAASFGAALGAFALVLSFLTFLASPATAQAPPCDPFYGCEPGEPTQHAAVTCSVEGGVFVAGDFVDVQVQGAQAGAAIDVTLDGNPVGSGTANADGNATITFAVPDGTPGGTHRVFAQGAGFAADCGTIQTGEVLSETQTRSANSVSATSHSGASGSGGSGLARTGMELGLYLAIALVLVLVGSRLVQMARRRRRRALRRSNAVAALTPHD